MLQLSYPPHFVLLSPLTVKLPYGVQMQQIQFAQLLEGVQVTWHLELHVPSLFFSDSRHFSRIHGSLWFVNRSAPEETLDERTGPHTASIHFGSKIARFLSTDEGSDHRYHISEVNRNKFHLGAMAATLESPSAAVNQRVPLRWRSLSFPSQSRCLLNFESATVLFPIMWNKGLHVVLSF